MAWINRDLLNFYIDIIISMIRLEDSACLLPCPGPGLCGGHEAVDVHYTGLRVTKDTLPPSPRDSVRIAFILTVSGEERRCRWLNWFAVKIDELPCNL